MSDCHQWKMLFRCASYSWVLSWRFRNDETYVVKGAYYLLTQEWQTNLPLLCGTRWRRWRYLYLWDIYYIIKFQQSIIWCTVELSILILLLVSVVAGLTNVLHIYFLIVYSLVVCCITFFIGWTFNMHAEQFCTFFLNLMENMIFFPSKLLGLQCLVSLEKRNSHLSR